MRALLLPYPPPRESVEMAEICGMPFNFKRMIHFPERHVSYVIRAECSDEEFERCERQVRELVKRFAPGQEPEELQISLADSDSNP